MTGQNDDAAWRDIVANYGDRPVIDSEEPPAAPGPHADPRPVQDAAPTEPDHHPELATEGVAQERYVPPPPPPLPRVPVDRLAAWAGVFVSPLLLLLATLFRIPLPTMLAWALVASFLGGFGYLVAQMPRGPRDPFDDGAVL